MSRSEKIIWVFFAATSTQLAFLQPYIVLIPGERTNLFSGLLCFVTLAVAVVFSRKGAIRVKSPEFLISAALLGLADHQRLAQRFSSSCRVFVLMASGLGGFWCARLLLNHPANQRRFDLAGPGAAGRGHRAEPDRLLCHRAHRDLSNTHGHPLTNTIILLSFAPLVLLYRPSRLLKALAIALLCSGYAVLCLSERLTVVFIPIALCGLAVLFGTLRLKYLLLVLIPVIS